MHNAKDAEVFIMAKQFKLTSAMQSQNLKKAALAYTENGLPIFPVFGIDKNDKCLCSNNKCEHQGKHPIITRGYKGATTDLKQIEKWWTEYPKANIASPLIAGLFALDFDGLKGRKTFQKLGLEEFETLRAKTGKGFHLYVHADLQTKNNVLSGLDIRGGGEGGYIILPPSRHMSGKNYQWEIIRKAQNLPEHIIQKLISKQPDADSVSVTKEAFGKGTRNDDLFKLACSLKRQDVVDTTIREMLTQLNKLLCKPPLSAQELSTVLKSSKRYDKEKLTEFKCMSTIESQNINWFWYPYMPSGSIVFLDGHPGRGKSYFTMWLAALCSKGGRLPFSDEILPKRRVLILNAEDDPERTMRPRLEKAGADLSPDNIHFQDKFRPLTTEGIQILEAKIISFKPDLVIIDPLLTYMGSEVDTNKFNQVTEFLTYVDELARENNLCVICIRYMTKSSGEHAINKGLGSIGFAARARSVLHIGISRDNNDLIGFAHVKSNWSEKGATLLYRLAGGSKTESPKLEWVEVADYPAEALDPVQSVGRPKAEPHLSDILVELLANAPMGMVAIKQALKSRGMDISKSTIIRELRLIADLKGKSSKSLWYLR